MIRNTIRIGTWSSFRFLVALGVFVWAAGCNTGSAKTKSSAKAASVAQASALSAQDQAPPPQDTGGFDGQRAYDYTAKLVSFGPRPPDSDAIRKMQDYVYAQLQSDGCELQQDNFHAQTPIGVLTMRNIIAKTPGRTKGIILLLSHYDTLRLPGFVGADDGGSSSGLLLELARDLCGRAQPLSVWMAFVDGEEDQQNFTSSQQAQTTWNDSDALYGSRELAAKLELDGQLKDVKAVLLADMVGQKNTRLEREASSTPWLADFVWNIAAKLGYQSTFVAAKTGAITDDHVPFLAKHVPSVDVIDLNDYMQEGYWHTPQDTMDKISAKSLAITGHVFLASIAALEKGFADGTLPPKTAK